jgi:hypothetical protein
MDDDCIRMLQSSTKKYPTDFGLVELLFFAYIRAFKFLEAQTTALYLFKETNQWHYALWTVQAMVLINDSVRFSLKILEIANLIMVRLRKDHPDVASDRKYQLMFLFVMGKQRKYKDAIHYIQLNKEVFNSISGGVQGRLITEIGLWRESIKLGKENPNEKV